MTLLSIENLAKSFGMKPLLEDVTFSLDEDEKMGVIGANGSGKTTLLRIIAGEETADSGRVMFSGSPLIGYLPQNPTFDPSKTVLDAVFHEGNERTRLLHDYEVACRRLAESGGADEKLLARVTELAHQLDVVKGWDLEVEAKAILDRLGIQDSGALVGTLSGGQRKRVAMARALILRPDLLILDEPTNHLDADTIDWLERYLKGYTGALLLVTHDRYFLERITNRMLEIERGRTQRFEGNYSYYLQKKDEQAAQQEAESQRRANLVRRELAWLQRGAKARTTKQKARVDRARALQESQETTSTKQIELGAASTRLGTRVIELQQVSKSYGETTLLADFTYSFTRNDRVGIIGPNGAGKTTLLEIVAGRVQPDSGEVEIGQTVVVGYYDQESRALNEEMRVIDYVKEVAEYVRTADGALISASQMLERFLFSPNAQYTPIGKLSGGERRRLYLLRILMGAPNVLLLDEPTNDFDVQTLVALEEYLESFQGALIVVSHDRYFLDRTVEHLFRFEGNGEVREYPGNYSAFLEIREREAAEEAARSPARPPVEGKKETRSRSSEKKSGLSYAERRELAALERRIEEAEVRRAEVELLMEQAAANFEAFTELSLEHERLTEQLNVDVDRWGELASRSD